MHKETLAPQTAAVFAKFAESGLVGGDWYLAGGTALALLLGHRRSEDLDFFTQAKELPRNLTFGLRSLGEVSVVRGEAQTLEAVLQDVRVSFLSYPYPLIRPLVPFEGVMLADAADIAAMKLSAAANRGAKKDFFDLSVLMRTYPLEDMLAFFEEKFAGTNYNRLHLLKSVAFFDDAEGDPDPVMLEPVSWDEVKAALSREAHRLAQ